MAVSVNEARIYAENVSEKKVQDLEKYLDEALKESALTSNMVLIINNTSTNANFTGIPQSIIMKLFEKYRKVGWDIQFLNGNTIRFEPVERVASRV